MDALAVDRAFAAAWPAAEAEARGGWLHRASAGVTRRANSALALARPADLDAQLAATVGWYAAHGLVPRVQLGPEAHRLGLVDEVAARGWQLGDGACDVLVRPLARADAVAPDVHVEHREAPTDEWLDVWWAVSPRPGDGARAVATGILERVAAPARFLLGRTEDGAAAACALGVVAEGLLVVESVATLPERRRAGAASALAAGLVSWAAGLGAAHAVLAVERTSPEALAFWRRRGFTPASAWMYATPPAA